MIYWIVFHVPGTGFPFGERHKKSVTPEGVTDFCNPQSALTRAGRTGNGGVGRDPCFIALAGAADISAEGLAEVGDAFRGFTLLGGIGGQRAMGLEVQLAFPHGMSEIGDGIHAGLADRHTDGFGHLSQFFTAHRIEERNGSSGGAGDDFRFHRMYLCFLGD